MSEFDKLSNYKCYSSMVFANHFLLKKNRTRNVCEICMRICVQPKGEKALRRRDVKRNLFTRRRVYQRGCIESHESIEAAIKP